MKKISTLFCLSAMFFCRLSSFAQVSTYPFSQSVGTYTPLVGATILSQAPTFDDDQNFGQVNLGFTFNYHGVNFTTIGISDNCFAQLGSMTTTLYTALTSGSNVLAPMNGDMLGNSATHQLRYLTTGGAGNHIFTVEWFHWGKYNITGDEFNCQIILNEAIGSVSFVYAPVAPATAFTIGVGITGANASDFNDRTTTSNWSATTAGTTNAATCSFSNTIYPVSGLTFTWHGMAMNAGNDTTICTGGSTLLNGFATGGTAPYTYQWLPTTGLSNPNIINPVATVNSPITYVLIITDANNNIMSDTVHISITNPLSSLSMSATNNNFCSGGTTQLSTGSSSSNYFAWTPSATLNNATSATPIATPTSTTTYFVTVTDACGNSLSDSIVIYVNANPTVTLNPSSGMICFGDTAILTAGGAVSYTISPVSLNGSSPFLVNPSSSTTYVVTGVGGNGCSATASATVNVDMMCVWPGDANHNGITNNADLINIGMAFGHSGTVRANASINYVHQPATNWATSTMGVNDKHADTNGDGVVNIADTLAVSQNFGLVHPRIEGNNNFNTVNPPLQLVILEDSVSNNDIVHAMITLGDAGNVAGDIYGLSFTVGYDNSVVSSNTAHISFSNSTLAPAGNQISVTKDSWITGGIATGVSRIDQTNYNGNSVVGLCTVKINTSGITSSQLLNLTISDITAKDISGNDVMLDPVNDNVLVTMASTNNPTINAQDFNILLFPNPTADEINIAFKGAVANEIKIENIIGQTVYTNEKPAQVNTVDVSTLPNGVYMVICSNGNKTAEKKLIIAR